MDLNYLENTIGVYGVDMKQLNLFILRVTVWVASVALFVIVIRVIEDMQ